MPAQWTGDILGKMHLEKVTAKELAEEAGLNRKYLSRIINGHVEPKNAEIKLNEALDRIIEKRKEADADGKD